MESSKSSMLSLSQKDVDVLFLGNAKTASNSSVGKLMNAELGAESSKSMIQLTLLQRYAMYAVLENVINQLTIISSILSARERPQWYATFRHIPINLRFGSEPMPKLLLPEVQGLQDLTDMQKMQRDLCSLQMTLRRIITEMLDANKYDTLLRSVFEIEAHSESEETLIDEYRDHLEKLCTLKRTLERERKIAKKERNRAAHTVHNLDNEIHDATLKADLTIRTINRWEHARLSQNTQRLELDEERISHMTNTASQDIINENEIHEQIIKYLDVVTNDFRAGIDAWMSRYDNDSEQLDTDILKIRGNIATQKTDIGEISAIIVERQIEIDEWIADKEERRRQAELLAKLHANATKIQAAWRGYMMRHFLGGYKKIKAWYMKTKAAIETAKKKKK